jgi:hypothetical protein
MVEARYPPFFAPLWLLVSPRGLPEVPGPACHESLASFRKHWGEKDARDTSLLGVSSGIAEQRGEQPHRSKTVAMPRVINIIRRSVAGRNVHFWNDHSSLCVCMEDKPAVFLP